MVKKIGAQYKLKPTSSLFPTRLAFKEAVLKAACSAEYTDAPAEAATTYDPPGTTAPAATATQPPPADAMEESLLEFERDDDLPPLPSTLRDSLMSVEELTKLGNETLKFRLQEACPGISLAGTVAKLAKRLLRVTAKLHRDPDFVRRYISAASVKGKPPPLSFHGQHFAAVDKFDQAMSYIATADRMGNKKLSLFRYVVEATVVQSHSLRAEKEWRSESRRTTTVLAHLRAIIAQHEKEQHELRLLYNAQPERAQRKK